MPRRNGIAFTVLRRKGDEWDWEIEEPEPEQELPPAALRTSRRHSSRLGVAAMFTTLFFAGAAFTAGAGDQLAKVLDDDAGAISELDEIAAAREPAVDPAAAPVSASEATAAEPEAPAPEQAPTGEPALEAEPAAPVDETQVELAPVDPVTDASTPEAAAPQPAPQTAATTGVAKALQRHAPPPVRPKARSVVRPASVALAPVPAPAPEVEHHRGYGQPTVWLNRALPDPTPPSARLSRSFTKSLFATARQRDADWAAVLGVLRAEGEQGPAPAKRAELDAVASQLGAAQTWRGALALSGRTDFADSAEALADLYRSVGIEALVTGYEAAKDKLAKRLLADERVLIYAAGREDIAAGRIDVRLIVLLGYLAERHGSVTVSSLASGHRQFARPGVVSAHVYGHAVDIAAVGGISIAGHQQPGGPTEEAVRSILLLPTELQPQQVISLLGLGGPSFPMSDHGDHIHVGF
ncbi:MAG: hypothetical protein QOJ43_98 [Gaiellaceae bacterium]|nr:hypothetical protein [Gaiellaceae bacterium]